MSNDEVCYLKNFRPTEAAVMFHLHDENEDAGNVGKPYSIEVRDMERTITIYGIASTRLDIAG